jgi:hypothetical protein
VNQPPRRFRPELQDDIIAEVEKLVNASFIKEVNAHGGSPILSP